jgi:hypothetical protein
MDEDMGTVKQDLEIGAGAPDPAACRAEAIFQDAKVAWCKRGQGTVCKFSLPYGSDLVCCHPERERIVARTLGQRYANASRARATLQT